MTEANLILRGLEELYPENLFIARLLYCIEQYPNANWGDAMSRGQIRSKMWIMHELIRLGLTDLGRVCICGGWYGILARLILDNPDLHTHHLISLDQDLLCSGIALELNKEYQRDDVFMTLTMDMCRLGDYQYQDTIINTSSEHLYPHKFHQWWDAIPAGKLMILQSNNFFEHEEHFNCVNDQWELTEMVPMDKVHYAGAMATHKYTRFMVIGVK